MTEYREILRLNALGLSGRSIAGSVSRSRNTVADVLSRAGKLGLEWPLPLEMTDIELERMLYPEKSGGDLLPRRLTLRKSTGNLHTPE